MLSWHTTAIGAAMGMEVIVTTKATDPATTIAIGTAIGGNTIAGITTGRVIAILRGGAIATVGKVFSSSSAVIDPSR